MNPSHFPAWLAVPVLLLSSCDRPAPPLTTTPPPAPTAPAMDDERAELEAEIDRLRAAEHEATTRLLEQQQAVLSRDRESLEQERAELARAREELAAAASAKNAIPVAEPVREEPAEKPASAPRPARTASTAADRDYQMFYEGLAPYGQWLESGEYGWVWQPNVVRESDWRPYTRGRWVDSDQGWAWVSDEPFGWATYHYGRWALVANHGWIWVPGETWAPAWVAWRRNEECVGWAPLPPETIYDDDITYGPEVEADFGLSAEWYTFLPVRHFDAPVFSHCRPIAENRHFFSLTVGISHIVVRSDRVVCGGPEPRWINSCLSRPMTRHTLHRRQEWRDRGDFRSHFENNRLTCYSPRVRAEWNDGIRPARSHGRLNEVRVVRREESFRRDLARRYQDQRTERRQHAVTALQNEPVRELARRHEELESLRARQIVAETAREPRPNRGNPAADRPRDTPRPTDTPSVPSPATLKNQQDRQAAFARVQEKREAAATATQSEEGTRDDAKARPQPPVRPLDKPTPPRKQQAAREQSVADATTRPEIPRRPQEKPRQGDGPIGTETPQDAPAQVPAENARRTEAPTTEGRREEALRQAAERQQVAEAKARAEIQKQEDSQRQDTERQRAAEVAQAKERAGQKARAESQENSQSENARREAAERQQAAQAKERAEQSRRAETEKHSQRENARREAAERQQVAQAKERAEQKARAESQENSQRENARREAAERQQAAQAKERAEQSRRAQDRENDERRREAAERQKAAEDRSRADESRRSQEREANERQRESDRRQQEETRSRAKRSEEDRERNKK